MHRRTRRIIFYSLVLAFTFAGPLLVAYSFGYTFNLSTVSFEPAGGIFIKSATPRLAVFLDGVFVQETGLITGSTILSDLRPGPHLVRLEKIGFRPWSKTVMVEPTEVTELRSVMLIPYEIAAATSTPIEFEAARATTTSPEVLTLDPKGNLIAGRGSAARKIAENVHSFASIGDAVLFVARSGFLGRFTPSTREFATLGRPGFFLDKKPLRFIPGGEFAAVIDSSGGLFIYNETDGTIEPVASGVKDVSFDSTQEKLLMFKERTVEILRLRDNPRQPFQQKGMIETIVAESQLIRGAQWFYATNAHIVWRTGEGTFIAEIDGRGGRNTAEIVSGPTDEILTSPSLPNAIFYKKGKAVYKIEL